MTAPSPGPVRGRYAPSPTGALHLGNLRTALLAWLFARHAGGQFVVRIEDLDLPRIRPGATERMLADLRWLGLDWDEGPDVGGPYGPYIQSARRAIYDAALASLREAGLVYPCYCSRAELASTGRTYSARLASAPRAGDDAPRYPGTCRELSDAERRAREAAGRRPALRFRAPDAPIRFRDTLHGEREESVTETVGDFLVRRSDGIVAYQLAVVVDDALMGITQVVRGDDLLPSTARQLALYAALGACHAPLRPPREYVHVPLLLDTAGTRMAKRDGALGLDPLHEEGARPEEVLGMLAASCGLWLPGAPASLEELLAAFALERIGA